MDLVDFGEGVFDRIAADFTEFAAPLDIENLTFIPISALDGDNVVDGSARMPWYEGPTLLDHLEQVQIARDLDRHDARFPVQWVIRPHPSLNPDYRGYAGRMGGGAFRVGDEVVVLPSGVSTRIARINGPEGELDMAFAPMSVTLRLEDDVDASRGDMICPAVNSPAPVREFTADVCWMAARPLRAGGCYAIKHTTRSARAVVEEVEHRVHVHALKPYMADELTLNDIGRVRMRTSAPLVADPYARNRTSGSFIFIDEATNDTVGAGMVVDPDA
jgi:bifunctional enzyme CysN/CysC